MTAPLGRSGVEVSRVGLGTSAIGGLYEALDDAAAAETLRAAWSSGCRYFDTAPHYGAGVAERRLGAFLRQVPRDEVVVSSKVGRLLRPGAATAEFGGEPELTRVRDYSAAGIYQSLAESLERTGLDRFDVLLIHDPDDHWEQAVGEAYPALDRLRSEGAVRAIGAGMNQSEMLTRFVTETDVDCVLLAGRYSLLDRSGADLLSRCADRGVGVIAGGVFNSGVLADPGPAAHFDYRPVPEDIRKRVTQLVEVCAAYSVPLPAAAIQFVLRHPAVSSVVIGARTPAEVTANAGFAALDLPAPLWTELDALAASW